MKKTVIIVLALCLLVGGCARSAPEENETLTPIPNP